MKRRLLVVLAFAATGVLAGAACGFPDVMFGAADGAATDPDARDEDGNVIVPQDGDVPPGDGGAKDADAAPRIDAAAVCPEICADAGLGKCDDAGTCTVSCGVDGTCTKPIVCPDGIPCAITCGGAGHVHGTDRLSGGELVCHRLRRRWLVHEHDPVRRRHVQGGVHRRRQLYGAGHLHRDDVQHPVHRYRHLREARLVQR